MTENFKEGQMPPKDFKNQPPEKLTPPKLTFSENMAELAESFKPKTFNEFTNLDGLKEVKAGVGINLPFSKKDSTEVTAGIEARVSVFNTPKGANVTTGVLPTVRISQDIGKNCKLTASVKPSQFEFAKIGFRLNF